MKTLRTLMQAIAGAIAIGAVVSCSDSLSPTGARTTSTRVATGDTPASLDLGDATRTFFGVTLLSCSAMTADSVSQDIGVSGGTINVGPHTLEIPAFALDSTVTITAIAPADTINRVILLPSGLQFAKKASLTLSYANCDPISVLVPKRVAYVSHDLSQVLDLLPSLDDVLSMRVRGKLDHFSDYVVAW